MICAPSHAAAPKAELSPLDATIARVVAAQKLYATFTQEQVDRIVAAAASAAVNARIDLAKAAVAETGMGVIEDKVIKNQFAAEYILNKYRTAKTCGTISYDASAGIRTIAEPVGVVAAVVPTTNPTSTAIFKVLLALKTRNGIVISPHPRAKGSTIRAAQIVMHAAEAAGAPAGLVGWISEPTVEASQNLMKHPDIAIILATGGPAMVKSAYASGKPALGVGAGNTPALIDETADLNMAVNAILLSKTFDNGMICASEQSVIVVASVYDQVKRAFTANGAYLLSADEKAALGAVIIKDGRLNPGIVGQPAAKIAAMAGLVVPATTKILLVECETIGFDEPFSLEKLSPVLSLYRADDFKAGVTKATALVEFGGLGHTSVLYTAPANQDRIQTFAGAVRACRVLVNTPASHGAIGDLFNFYLAPSLTLGCGTWGGNSVSENVGVKHLINLKTVAERRENCLWYKVPSRIYFKSGCLPVAFTDLQGRKRALIVTDRTMVEIGTAGKVADLLRAQGLAVDIFDQVKPDPDLNTVEDGVRLLSVCKPDTIVALGGGSPIDCAKIMWLLYEKPDISFADISQRFMDIRKRIHSIGTLGAKAWFVAVPTTSGTGSEVTPFAVITGKDGVKYPIADYALTPTMAVVDPDLTLHMPKKLTAASGVDAISHALEALVSVLGTEFTEGQAIDALRLLFRWLPAAYRDGAKNPEARERVHYAATLAGMAFSNAFLGICHSLAHKLGGEFHIPHGVANAILLPHVIRYNATNAPGKFPAFAQYTEPQAIARYAKAADALGLSGATPEAKVEALIAALQKLCVELDIPATISAAGVDRDVFLARVGDLAERAFDDQCTGANPRFPLIADLKAIYEAAL